MEEDDNFFKQSHEIEGTKFRYIIHGVPKNKQYTYLYFNIYNQVYNKY
jgi:hypothetical protein